jgi:hypothetical protein
MKDTLYCPICNNKLKNKKLKNQNLYLINNCSDYIERTCSDGFNHTLQFFTEQKTKKVHLLKTSLNHNYSKFIEIDYLNNKSRISCFKMGKPEYIEIDKVIDTDFPKLDNLKNKINTYVAFS